MLEKTSLERLALQLQAQGDLGPGRNFWVGAGTAQHRQIGASNNNTGLDPLAPMATLEAATNKCTAGRGDNVLVLPGHTESMATSATWVCDIADVTYHGLGKGTSIPTITQTADVTVAVSVANVTMRNLVLTCNFADIAAMMTVSGASFEMDNCQLNLGTTTNDCVVGILTTAAANNMYIHGSRFYGVNRGGAAGGVDPDQALQIVGGDGIKLIGNHISARFVAASGGVEIITTASSNMVITGNLMQNYTTASEGCVTDTITGSTGIIDDNRMFVHGSGTSPIITGETFEWGRNWMANALNVEMVVTS